ncbi:hypothetical protein ACFP1Z_21565 [Streptomyces gamaensis]|uniref:Uncharacterized protein n=1 Tax=Streptomyces gamaensis TaxID=1763542 RepID=A0ABW0Z618_9ACTN
MSVACGPIEKISAGAKVQQGFEKLGERKALTAEFRIAASEDQIWSALKDSKGFERDYAKIMAGMRVSAWVDSDKPVREVLKSPEANTYVPGGYALALDGGEPVMDIRSDGRTMYQRMDFKRIAGMTAKGREGLEQGLGELEKMPSPFKEMMSGQWLAYDIKDFEEFTKNKPGFGGPGGGPAARLDVQDQKKILDAFKKALVDNADLKDAGSKGGADHVTAIVPAKKAVQDLAEGLKPLAEKNPSFPPVPDDVTDVPEKDIKFDIAIKGGVVRELTLDLAQFAKDGKKPNGELPLSISFKGEAPAFKAPSGAKKIKPQDVERAVGDLQSAKLGEAGTGKGSPSAGSKGSAPGGHSSAEIERQLEKMRKMEREHPSADMKKLRENLEELRDLQHGTEAL